MTDSQPKMSTNPASSSASKESVISTQSTSTSTTVKNAIHITYHHIAPDKSGDSKPPEEQASEMFESKLAEASEQIYNTGYECPSVISGLVVEQVAISDSHMAFLLDNGRVCRIGYRVKPSATLQAASTSSRGAKQAKTSGDIILPGGLFISGQSRSSGASRGLSSSTKAAAAAFIIPAAAAAAAAATSSELMSRTSSGLSGASRRATHLIRSRAGLNSAVLSAGRILPVSAVPESLIESVQTVLQSKSRSVIIRELQRTNLDVNLAVNNLLQRDDEADEQPTDTDDDDSDAYMHGDDLISLLDINSAAAAAAAAAAASSNANAAAVHESILDHQDPDMTASFRLAAARRFGNASALSKPTLCTRW